MNAIVKVKDKASEVRDIVIKKAVPLSVAAASSVNMLMLQAFATEGSSGSSSSGVDISSVTTSMTSSLTDLVQNAALACAGVVGVGLTIFGIKWVVKTIKSFFSRIAG